MSDLIRLNNFLLDEDDMPSTDIPGACGKRPQIDNQRRLCDVSRLREVAARDDEYSYSVAHKKERLMRAVRSSGVKRPPVRMACRKRKRVDSEH